MGGKFVPRLNMDPRPIANKYCEGKVKSTLKRELKGREIVKMEGYELSTGARRVNRVASVQRGSEDVFVLHEGSSACAASLYLAPA